MNLRHPMGVFHSFSIKDVFFMIKCTFVLMWRHIQRSTFEELLERDETISIRHKNVQSLAIELYKFLNGYSPEIINSLFHLKENNRYSLRNVYELYSHNPKIVKYGTETISYLAPEIWSTVR